MLSTQNELCQPEVNAQGSLTMSTILTALKDMIMLTPITSRPVSQRPSAITPRKAACTHLHLTRLYGKHTCSHCGKVPPIGWVYKCTQDVGGSCSVPGNEHDMEKFNKQNEQSLVDEEEQGDDNIELSAWVEKARLEGHYTPEQVAILRAQRRNVLECIKKDLESIAHPVPPRPLTPANPLSMTQVLDQMGSLSVTEDKVVVGCSYKACSTCRPMNRDRAWECVDYGLKVKVEPISFEKDNRPTSALSLLRQIGLRVLKRRQHSRTVSELTENTATSKSSSRVINLVKSSPSLRKRHAQSRRRVSLRDSFKESTKTSPLILDATNGLAESTTGPGKTASSIVADLCSENKAPKSSKWLPTGDDLKQEQGNGLKVVNGVAMTEEAVDLGSADIIIQA